MRVVLMCDIYQRLALNAQTDTVRLTHPFKLNTRSMIKGPEDKTGGRP